MADKSFGVKDINLIGASGTPEIESPNNLNIKATNVAISTDMSVGGELTVTDTFLKPQAVGLGTTTATGRDAGISTATGTLIYVPDVGLQVYAGDAAGWKTIADTSASVAYFSATGGDVTVEPGNGYKYHTFTNTGDFVTGSLAGTVEVLIVGGGGGGGDYADAGNAGGAGGAGGLVHHAALSLSASTTYPIVIGNGGPDSPSPNGTYVGGNGDDFSILWYDCQGWWRWWWIYRRWCNWWFRWRWCRVLDPQTKHHKTSHSNQIQTLVSSVMEMEEQVILVPVTLVVVVEQVPLEIIMVADKVVLAV